MTNEKINLLRAAGCTEQQIKKYVRHQKERSQNKTPHPTLRQNYQACNGRLEVYQRGLEKAAKAEAKGKKPQEKKDASVWAITGAQCLADHTAFLPEGMITLEQIWEETKYAAFVEGVNGVLPDLGMVDNGKRFKFGPVFEALVENYTDCCIPVHFDGVAYAADYRKRMGDLWNKAPNADLWEKGYSETVPHAVEQSWVRNNGIRREMREAVEKVMLEHFYSLKKDS